METICRYIIFSLTFSTQCINGGASNNTAMMMLVSMPGGLLAVCIHLYVSYALRKTLAWVEKHNNR
jgi:hypothetical protein